MIDFWILGRPQSFRKIVISLAAGALFFASAPAFLMADGGNGGDSINGAGGQGGAYAMPGQAGGAAGSGGGGGGPGEAGTAGAGGAGAANGGTPGAGGTAGATAGAAGQDGFDGTGNSGGGGGGGGANGLADQASINNASAVLGGDGGDGGEGPAGGGQATGGGGGGAGGFGVRVTGAAANTNSVSLTGGAGGDGGIGDFATGNGGEGGHGIQFTATGATLQNDGSITGGAGGAGEVGGIGGTGVLADGLILTNTSAILGGMGGNGSTNGVGGAAIQGSNLTIINAGSLTGGMNGNNTIQANAVTFTSGTNILELQAGWTISGNAAGGGTDTLRLGGTTNDTFDASRLGAATDGFQNFETFEKSGTSTWFLSGAATFAGTTNINAGTLNFDASNNFGTSAITFDAGTLQWATGTTSDISSGHTITFAAGGAIFDTNGNNVDIANSIGNGGAGGLTKTGLGNLTLFVANNYNGATAVNQGSLIVNDNDVLPTTTTVSIATGATLALANSSQEIAGLSGTGTVDFGNGVNSALTVTISNAATNSTFGGDFTSTGVVGQLNKDGPGTLTLNGANIGTIGNGVTVDGGALYINGILTSNSFTANNLGTLGGTGTLTGADLASQDNGIIDPGPAPNAIGTLSVVGGGYAPFVNTVGSTGILHIDFDGGAVQKNDLLTVTGAATLDAVDNPVMVEVHLVGSATVVPNQQYIFLHSDTGITGQFAGITDDLPMIDFLLGFDANNYWFYIVGSNTNFASVALTPNELSVANYLDQTAPTASGDYQTVIDQLNLLNASQLRSAFNQLSGEAYGTTGQFGVNTTTLMLQQVANHLSAASMFGPQGGSSSVNLMAQVSPTANSAASPNNVQLVSHSEIPTAEATKAESCCLCYDTCENQKLWNGWSAGYGLGGSAQSDGNASGASYGVGGFLAGVDRWVDDSTLVGVFGGYLGSGFSTGTPSANVHDNAGQGGIYALRRGDVFYASALIGGQSDQYTSRRNINFGTINRTATGNYDGWQGFGYTELGANLSVPGWHRHSCLCQNNLTLQPYGAFQYIHLRQNSISETGAGSLNLASGGMDTDSLRSFLGTRLRYDNHGEGNLRRFVPELQASWLHEYIDSSTSLNARFGAVGGNGFTATGLNVGRDWALLGAGITYVVTDNIRLTANYYAQTNDRQTYHVGAGGLAFQW